MAEIDFDGIRLTAVNELIPAKKLLVTVPCRRPSKQEFFRVRVGDEWQLNSMILRSEEDRATYLVSPIYWPEVSEHLKPVCLRVATNRQGFVFVIPVPLPSADGRENDWNTSFRAAVVHAETRWVRMAANMAAGSYEVSEALGNLPEPTWPEEDLKTLLSLSFKNRYIDADDHPVLRALRGEA